MSEQVEEELYGLLAEWIALRGAQGALIEAKNKPNGFRKAEINHYFMTSFEISCDLMLKLGLYKRSKTHPVCVFYFATAQNRLATKAVRNRKKGASFKELLACFLDLAGHFEDLELRVNKSFKVHPDRGRLFDLLEKMGYLWQRGGFCYWTSQIDSIMDDPVRFYDRRSLGKEPFR